MLAHPRVYERKTSDTPSFFFQTQAGAGGRHTKKHLMNKKNWKKLTIYSFVLIRT